MFEGDFADMFGGNFSLMLMGGPSRERRRRRWRRRRVLGNMKEKKDSIFWTNLRALRLSVIWKTLRIKMKPKQEYLNVIIMKVALMRNGKILFM